MKPKVALLRRTAPTLYADGIHDDAPALQALFYGCPVRHYLGTRCMFEHGGDALGNVFLRDCEFYIGQSIKLNPDVYVDMRNCIINTTGPGVDIDMRNGKGAITNCIFDGASQVLMPPEAKETIEYTRWRGADNAILK